MFERFTDLARRVVVLAQEEARLLNHGYIGTEHLLLGLIREGEGVAAQALESLGIGLESVRQQVEAAIGRGSQPPSGHIPFTAQAKQVLELSLREAGELGHDYIGTEHLLLGLIREGKGVAAQVLAGLGADLNRVRRQVIQLATGLPAEGATPAGRPAGRRGRTGLIDEALSRIAAVDQRLAAVERRVGMAPELHDLGEEIARARRKKESAIDAQDFETAAALRDRERALLAQKASREKEWAADAAGGPSLAAEFGRLSAELDRLRAILRDHGIETGDDAA